MGVGNLSPIVTQAWRKLPGAAVSAGEVLVFYRCKHNVAYYEKLRKLQQMREK